jgi:hypothetical protein
VLDFFDFMQYMNIFDVFTFTANFRCVMVSRLECKLTRVDFPSRFQDYNYYDVLLVKNIGPLVVLSALVVFMLFSSITLDPSVKALLLNAALLVSGL